MCLVHVNFSHVLSIHIYTEAHSRVTLVASSGKGPPRHLTLDTSRSRPQSPRRERVAKWAKSFQANLYTTTKVSSRARRRETGRLFIWSAGRGVQVYSAGNRLLVKSRARLSGGRYV